MTIGNVWGRVRGILLIALAPLALLAGAAPPPAQPTAQATPPSYFGLHIHRADAGSPWPPFKIGSWRLWDAYVAWPSLEPERGQWDFKRLDRYVAMAKLQGVELLLPLALSPTWASARPSERSGYKPGNAAEPKNIEDWRNYVRTVAERYKGRIRYYEIWNEPSDKAFYTGEVETLVSLAREAHQILKAVDPDNQLVSPGMAGGGRHLEYLDEYLGKGGRLYADIVGYHFYVWKTGPEAMLPLIREVRRIMARNGLAAKPLWNTETGWWIENGDGTPDHPMVSKGGWTRLGVQEESGAYLARALILGRAEGLDRFFWYSWDNLYGLGMREPTSGKPKPMSDAYGTVTRWLTGAMLKQCSRASVVWTCPLVLADGKTAWIVWTEGDAEQDWIMPVAWGVDRVERLDGGATTPIGSTIRIGVAPVLLLAKGNAER